MANYRVSDTSDSQPHKTPPGRSPFTERPVWQPVGEGWQPLSGRFNEGGCSVEWHDFETAQDLDLTPSFHPGSVEICLNLLGNGEVRAASQVLALDPSSIGFYAQSKTGLKGRRRAGEHHQFLTIEFSFPFLRQQGLWQDPAALHPCLRRMAGAKSGGGAAVSERSRLTSEQRHTLLSLRNPPVSAPAALVWYRAKALELAATVLFQPAAADNLFCERQKELNRGRVEKVAAILREQMAEPPSLEEIGRRVGCSHYHLTRIFTQEMGKTISCYLRDVRLERAAELLRAGQMNVSSVALEVGYSSFSHFSAAFRETFGCCPGLYPLPVAKGR
ncbi:MAG TPA: AraC family transcriptional regulator [Verrucomicrobiae bacterium]|nr:AraC family transcriptional regulator [Verrucomicrobiae bacterium]